MISSISAIAKRYGFKKERHSWKKTSDFITIVLALQKSRYCNAFTFEIGICVDKTKNHDTLKYYNCGITFRLNKIPTANSIELDNALNLDLNYEGNSSPLINFLESDGMSEIMKLFSLKHLQLLYQEGFFIDKMIDNISVGILSRNNCSAGIM